MSCGTARIADQAVWMLSPWCSVLLHKLARVPSESTLCIDACWKTRRGKMDKALPHHAIASAACPLPLCLARTPDGTPSGGGSGPVCGPGIDRTNSIYWPGRCMQLVHLSCGASSWFQRWSGYEIPILGCANWSNHHLIARFALEQGHLAWVQTWCVLELGQL